MMASPESYHAGKPTHYNSTALTSLQVMSWPAPLGPPPLHGGKSSVVSSIPFRAPSTQALSKPRSHRGVPWSFLTKAASRASLAISRCPRRPDHATLAYNPCRYRGPSAALGSPREADALHALYPRSRPSAWPPSRLMLQVPTFTLSWQCHILHCLSCWFALSYTPTAFTDQCPLQVCRHFQSRCHVLRLER